MESSVALEWLTESVDLLVFYDSAHLWVMFNVRRSSADHLVKSLKARVPDRLAIMLVPESK